MVTGRKLLLADDSVTIQKVVDLTFSDEGIEVTAVGNGEQAISKLEEIQPDIVLADVFMPGRNGYEVCEHIKRDARFRHIPVLLLVGSFEPFDEAEARRVGADDYLTKPFQSIRQLVSKVTSLITGGGSADEPTTRKLEMPEELAGKEQAEGQAVDTSADEIHTADTAPLPEELADKEPAEAAAHLFGHESLDDEMIETRTASEVTPMPRDTIGAHDTRPTAPFSEDDIEEAGVEVSAQASPESLQETVRDFSMDEMNEEALSTEPRVQTQSHYMSNAAEADEALLDLGDIEPPLSTAEADDFILDLQDDAPAAAPEPQPASGAWPEAAQQPAVETAGWAASPDFSHPVQATPAHEFAEEIEPVIPETAEAAASAPAAEEAAPTEAYTAEESGVMESTAFEAEAAPEPFAPQQEMSQGFSEMTDASLQETVLAEEAPPAAMDAEATRAEVSAKTTQPTGQITLDQLSPEAIEAIARRAVELLSSKVVEEVAWEVVPQLAELLIKRKLEEEKSQTQ